VSDHRDVREALELAAVEPGGLDRLEAADTPEAAAVVGHLAGCPACLEEMARLRRADALLRPILSSQPDPALRKRTLAFVRALGVPRDAAGPLPSAPAAGRVPPAPAQRRGAPLGWVAALAAVLVIGLLGGAFVAGARAPRGNADPATALAAVARETGALLEAGDARQIALLDGSGTAGGTLILSPSADRLLVTAADLPAPPAGVGYRCWVEIDGARIELGAMWWAGGVAWWSGDVDLPAELPPGIGYGVSLVSDGTSGPGTDVLTGEL
jgi:hypothetical protein